MRCPKCKSNSQVLESLKKKTSVIRKRRCKRVSCQHRWKTIEQHYQEQKKKAPAVRNYTSKTDKYYDDLQTPLGESADRMEALEIIAGMGTFLED